MSLKNKDSKRKTKSKKNVSQKKVSSIATKINAKYISSIFSIFLLLDIIIIVSMVYLWCKNQTTMYFGSSKIESTALSFENIYKIKYILTSSDKGTLTINISDFLYSCRSLIKVIVITEVLFIIYQIIFSTAKIRKIMSPLNDLADVANKISKINFNENKTQTIENAISKISIDSLDEKITTGDSDLKGIEDAINGLILRMKDTYRNQAQFVSDASHELRTPIAVIQGYANMLDRWGKKDEDILNESITAIKSEAENMKNLVEQLLFLARGINGKMELNLKSFSLKEMMRGVYEESKMLDKDHEYILIDHEDVMAYGDEGLLKQVARIFIENSKKYTDKGGNITLKYGKNKKGEVYFYVQDNGIGMEDKDLPHIFDRFFRADEARNKKTGGTGLGLSIAKWIVDNHNGYFIVTSRKEIGTRIMVCLRDEL